VSILTKQQVRRGVYRDVPELIAAIETFIEGYNQCARPFVWTKTAQDILAKTDKQQPTSGTLHYGRGEGRIPREVDRPTAGDPQTARGPERLRATLVVREDDTFPAKSPGPGPGAQRRAAVEQRS